MIFRPKTKPRPYQAAALQRAFKCGGRYGLFLAPRTGKTKIAVDFCAALFQARKAFTVLVVCQLTGHPVWEEQLHIHCAAPYRLVTLPRGSKDKIRALNHLRPTKRQITFILLNYESSWRIERRLLKLRPDVVIYDEGHKLKNRSTKQSRSAHSLIQQLDPYRLLLTGTAISNSPLDLFSEYMVIDDSVFGRRWSLFARRYAMFQGMFNQIVKYRNMPDLRRKARSRATVLTKEECLDIKEPIRERVKVALAKRTRRHYDDMAESFIIDFEDDDTASAAIKLTQLLRLSQVTGGFVTTDNHVVRQIGSEKLETLEGKLDDLMDAGEKVVIFSRFRPEIDAIEALCKRNRWKAFKYYGKGKNETEAQHRERMKYPWKFHAYKGPAVFIAQCATGALSIDLSCAAYVIFFSYDYSLINWEQCHDRVYGNAQDRVVVYSYLIASDTVDESIYAALRSKKRISSLLNNVRALVSGDVEEEDVA